LVKHLQLFGIVIPQTLLSSTSCSIILNTVITAVRAHSARIGHACEDGI